MDTNANKICANVSKSKITNTDIEITQFKSLWTSKKSFTPCCRQLTCALMCPRSLNQKTGHKNSPDQNPVVNWVRYIARDGVSLENFRYWAAEMHANQLLGSVVALILFTYLLTYCKQGHVKLCCQKTDDGYQLIMVKGANVEFCLDQLCANDHC